MTAVSPSRTLHPPLSVTCSKQRQTWSQIYHGSFSLEWMVAEYRIGYWNGQDTEIPQSNRHGMRTAQLGLGFVILGRISQRRCHADGLLYGLRHLRQEDDLRIIKRWEHDIQTRICKTLGILATSCCFLGDTPVAGQKANQTHSAA